jgi:rod shape-determining protein MreB
LERTPPELSADIIDRGDYADRRGALLRRFDKRLAAVTGLRVFLAEDPLSSVVLGTSKMLTDFKLLRKIRVY